MKKNLVCGLFFLFSAALMVRPVVRSVNIPAGSAFPTVAVASAEGDPMPSPTGPDNPGAGLLAADDDPMPHPGGPHAATVA
jgi:hypothetical protein